MSIQSNIDYPLYQITKDPSGFVDNSLITIAYDSTTGVATITSSSGKIEIIEKRKLYSFTSPVVTSAHSLVFSGITKYYLTFSNGAFTWGTTPWTFDQVMVMAAVWNSTQTPKGYMEKETHGLMAWQDHEHFHQTVGTILTAGGTYGTITVPTAAATEGAPSPTQLSIDATTIEDEDIEHTLNALSAGSNYTIYYRNTTPAAGDWAWITSNKFPYYTSAADGRVSYNSPTGGWTATTANTNRVNYYCLAVPNGAAGVFRYIFIPGQTFYTSLSAARAETFQNLSLGTLSSQLPEYFVFMQITVKRESVTSSSIEAITYYRGNRAITVGTSASPSVHNTLSGRSDAGQHPLAAIFPTAANKFVVTNAGNTALTESTPTVTFTPGVTALTFAADATQTLASINNAQTWSGVQTFTSEIEVTGLSGGNRTSTARISFTSGSAFWVSYGADASTYGLHNIVQRTNDGTSITVAANDANGAWSFGVTGGASGGDPRRQLRHIFKAIGGGAADAANPNKSEVHILAQSSSGYAQPFISMQANGGAVGTYAPNFYLGVQDRPDAFITGAPSYSVCFVSGNGSQASAMHFSTAGYGGASHGNIASTGAWKFGPDDNTQVHDLRSPTQTTVGAAGGATALPATPTGYVEIKIKGTAFIIPYYAKS